MQREKRIIQIGEYGPIAVDENGQLTYGDLIRYTRKLYRLSPDDIAIVYGKIAGRPVTGRHILRMEQTDSFFPKAPDRRWILARLLNVPPALLALVSLSELEAQYRERKKMLVPSPTKNINAEEYRTTLQLYWSHRETMPFEALINDTKARIAQLHECVSYIGSGQKQVIGQLLCGYQILLADIAQEQQCWQAAKDYFTNAIILAREKHLYNLQAIALYRRAAFYDDLEIHHAALRDVEKAEQLPVSSAPQLHGKLLTIGSRARAAIAQDHADLSTALSKLEKASKLIEQPSHEEFAFFFGLTQERYCLDSAATLMASPLKKLRTPMRAQRYLDTINIDQKHKRSNVYRQIYSDLIQTKIYFDQGYDSVAITAAESALLNLKAIGSGVHLNTIASLLQGLKLRHPHNMEVVSLEVELMKVRQPYLFN